MLQQGLPWWRGARRGEQRRPWPHRHFGGLPPTRHLEQACDGGHARGARAMALVRAPGVSFEHPPTPRRAHGSMSPGHCGGLTPIRRHVPRKHHMANTWRWVGTCTHIRIRIHLYGLSLCLVPGPPIVVRSCGHAFRMLGPSQHRRQYVHIVILACVG